MGSLLEPIYRAVETGDPEEIERLLVEDVFMATPEAGGVLLSRDEAISFAAERFGPIRAACLAGSGSIPRR